MSRRIRLISLLLASLGVVATHQLPSLVRASTSPSWGIVLPVVFASGVQSSTPDAVLRQVSCPAVGTCTAVGNFRSTNGEYEAFAATSSNGTWTTAVVIPFPSGSQHSPIDSFLESVSCWSPGECAAVGGFRNTNGRIQPFVTTSSNGSWSTAAPVLFASNVQNSNPYAYLTSISCPSTGACSATGKFDDVNGRTRIFTTSRVGGVWEQALPMAFVPSVQSSYVNAEPSAITCTTAGNCALVGRFLNSSFDDEAFVVGSTNGVWGDAQAVSFPPNIHDPFTHNDRLDAVACASPGSCTAVGRFRNTSGDLEAFSISSVGGVWSTANPISFPPNSQTAQLRSRLNGVSCPTPLDCIAVGEFRNQSGERQAFHVSFSNGNWNTASPISIPTNIQNSPQDSTARLVDCTTSEGCLVTGTFDDSNGNTRTFSTFFVDGIWTAASFPAYPISGSPYGGFIDSIDCPMIGNCAAVGSFQDSASNREAFTLVSAYSIPSTTTIGPTNTTTSTTSVPTNSSPEETSIPPNPGSLPSVDSSDRLPETGGTDPGAVLVVTLITGGILIVQATRRRVV